MVATHVVSKRAQKIRSDEDIADNDDSHGPARLLLLLLLLLWTTRPAQTVIALSWVAQSQRIELTWYSKKPPKCTDEKRVNEQMKEKATRKLNSQSIG